MSIREDQVANAVRFLQNDRTQNATDDAKKDFLRKKGLTEGEINESLHRHSGGSASSSTPVPQPPAHAPAAPAAPSIAHAPYEQVVYPNYPPQQYMPPPMYYPQRESNSTSWWKILISGAVAAGLGFLANNYYRNQEQQKERERQPQIQTQTQPQAHGNALQLTEYASPQRQNMLPMENTKELEVANNTGSAPQIQVNLESLEELLKQQAKDQKEWMTRLLESQRQQAQTLQNITQKVASLSLNQTIKPQADLSDASLHILQETLLEAVRTNRANGAPLDDEIAEKVEKIKDCIKVMMNESESKEEARKSLNMLNIILDNLRRHPDTEKYRKVNTTSARFKERFSSNQKADEFFTAVGFESSGPNFIFPSGPMPPTVQKAMNLIADTLKDLDTVWNTSATTAASEDTSGAQLPQSGTSTSGNPSSVLAPLRMSSGAGMPERPDGGGGSPVAAHPAQSPMHPAESATSVDNSGKCASTPIVNHPAESVNHPAESVHSGGHQDADEGASMTPGG